MTAQYYGIKNNTNFVIDSNSALWQIGRNRLFLQSFPNQIDNGIWTQAIAGARANAGSMFGIKGGTLWSWGDNSAGQLGLNITTTIISSPLQVGTLSNWSIVDSSQHTLAIKTDGTLWAWGYGSNGVLGNNSQSTFSSPIQIGAQTSWTSISSGFQFSAGVNSGRMYTWGNNSFGQLGTNTTVLGNLLSPVQIGLLSTWSKVSCGYYNTTALKTDGTIWVWGYNLYGQLGLSDLTHRSSPVQVGAATNWASIMSGGYFVAAINSLGQLWTWGNNSNGQLGLSDNTHRSSPIQVGTLSTWSKFGANKTLFSTPVIKTNGTLWAWGYNGGGQLGNTNTTQTLSPIQVGNINDWTSAGIGYVNTLGIRKDGSLWVLGANSYRALAFDNLSYRSSAIQLGNVFGSAYIWKKFSVGSQNNSWSSVIDKFGSLQVFGDNTDGALNWTYWQKGTGQSLSRFRYNSLEGFYITGPNPVVNSGSISSGSFNTFNIKNDGTLWSMGINDFGQLGLSDTTNRSSPVQVGTLSNWDQISCGYKHTLAIKNDGSLWSFGLNTYGALGLSDVTSRSSPVQVGTLSNWLQTSSGRMFSLAVKVDNTLWAWGNNSNGQLGNNTTTGTNLLSPIQIGTLSNWLIVEASTISSFGIKTDGTLWSWGNDADGQLGLNTTTGYQSPIQIGTSSNWTQVSASLIPAINGHVFALQYNGTLWAWGNNSYGQLGLGDFTNRLSPVQIGTSSNWVQVVGRSTGVLGFQGDGSLWAWGVNSFGQLGNNSATTISTPVQIGTLSNWNKISTGISHSAIFKNDGTLWVLGNNSNGQLGLNTTTGSLSSPVQVGTLSNWTTTISSASFGFQFGTFIKGDGSLWSWGNITNGQPGLQAWQFTPLPLGDVSWSKTIGARDLHLGIKADGTLWSWGGNSFGQAGTSSTARTSQPVQLGPDAWNDIACGYYSSAAIKQDSTLWVWGNNSFGQLGLSDVTHRYSPVQLSSSNGWTAVAAGGPTNSFTVAINSGALWAWGDNSYGALGTSDITFRGSPVQVSALTNWSQVAAGRLFAMAIKTDGTLWSWGVNSYGQLGLSNVTHRSSPVQVGASTNWAQVACGQQSTVALNSAGQIWAWGYNAFGQLGTSNQTNYSSPVQVGTLGTWNSIACGYQHVVATKTDGSLWVWGNNSFGQLGTSINLLHVSSPIQIMTSLSWTKAMGTGHYMSFAMKNDSSLWSWSYGAGVIFGQSGKNYVYIPQQIPSDQFQTYWTQTAQGYNHVAAINSAGQLWTWGSNSFGQLGLNTTTGAPLLTPVQVGTLSNWSSISFGTYHSLALKTDGTLWSWGNNSFGQLGLSDVTHRYSPVQVGASTNWAQISCGYFHILAINSLGQLYAWGNNGDGQLGTSDSVQRNSPVQIGSLTNWSQVSTGGRATVAIKTDGTLWAWGSNSFGQLGTNTTTLSSILSPIQINTNYWSKIKINVSSVLALNSLGQLWSWGSNSVGQLGLSDQTHRSSPTQVGILNNWSQIGGLSNTGPPTNFAIKTDGTLWGWGYNNANQLAPGDSSSRLSPVQIGTASNYSQIFSNSYGGTTAFVIKTDGTLLGWGSNVFGQSGNNNTSTGYLSPTQITRYDYVYNWAQVACGQNHTLAINSNGNLFVWGFNNTGQLGTNDLVSRSSVVQVGVATNWASIAGGQNHSAAVNSLGQLFTWGNNSFGQLGVDNLSAQYLIPVQVGQLGYNSSAKYSNVFCMNFTTLANLQ